jgi:hypothetical protein
MNKGQCQFGQDGANRCENPATRKWGDHWFCDEHGRRSFKKLVQNSAQDLIEALSEPNQICGITLSKTQPTSPGLYIFHGVFPQFITIIEKNEELVNLDGRTHFSRWAGLWSNKIEFSGL